MSEPNQISLSDEKLCIYECLCKCYGGLQDKYLLFSQTVENIAEGFRLDKEKVVEILEELERMNLIELDFTLDMKYAKMTIHEPEQGAHELCE